MTPVRNFCFVEFISFFTTKNLLLGWISSHRAGHGRDLGRRGCAPDLTYLDRLKVGCHVYVCIS